MGFEYLPEIFGSSMNTEGSLNRQNLNYFYIVLNPDIYWRKLAQSRELKCRSTRKINLVERDLNKRNKEIWSRGIRASGQVSTRLASQLLNTRFPLYAFISHLIHIPLVNRNTLVIAILAYLIYCIR